MSHSTFKKDHSFKERKEVTEKLRAKYPNMIPIIVEKAYNCTLPDIKRKKFLVPNEVTLAKFLYEVRKHIALGPEQAIFLFADNYLLPITAHIYTIYDRHKDDDGFLYLFYQGENVFG